MGVKRNNDETMDDEPSTDEDRGPMLGITDVGELIKHLELLIRSMERMMRRISSTSKGDPAIGEVKDG